MEMGEDHECINKQTDQRKQIYSEVPVMQILTLQHDS